MSKRGNAEGSLYEQTERRTHKDGTVAQRKRWVGAVTLEDGKRKVVYGKTREEASSKLLEAMQAKKHGLPPSDNRLTVGRHLSSWLEDVVRPRVRPSTFVSYAALINNHILPSLGKRSLTKLSPSDVQQFLNAKRREGLSARTVSYLRRVLSMALGQAVTWGHLQRNVAGKGYVSPPKGPAREIEPLTAEQVAALMAVNRGRSMEQLVILALSTGLRKGELLALTWADVDLDASRLNVRRALDWANGRHWSFVEPKSASGKRAVPLIGPAVAALRTQKARVNALELKALPGTWQEHTLVFPSELGTPIHPTNVNREFKKLLKLAGLPTTTRVHDLRHGAATFLLEAGVDGRVVVSILGWSPGTASQMLARYQHVRAVALDDAAARLEMRLATIPGLG